MDPERKVLLMYEGGKRVGALPPLGSATDHADLTAIKELAKSLYDDLASKETSDVVIRTFDADFEDWVDLSNPFVATSKQKFQVVLLDRRESGKEPLGDITNLGALLQQRIVQPESIPEIMTDEETSHDYGVCSTPLPQPALRSVLRERVLEKPLPVPFTLPSNYPPIVAVGLQAKQLSGKAMVKFITVIANAVFNFKSYPTKDEKEHVARQCVKAFPFLEANCGSGHGYLVVALEERMKYLRRPHKRSQVESGGTPQAKRPPKLLMPQVAPITRHAIGEDDASKARNTKMLQALSKQLHPDQGSVEDLMERTFAARRHDLQNPENTGSIHDFLEEYPFLAKFPQIQCEFNRVVAKQHASFMAAKLRWLEVAPKILALAEADKNSQISSLLQLNLEEMDEGSLGLVALQVLQYLIPDPHSKPDHTRVMKIVPVNANLAREAELLPTKQCCLLVTGKPEESKEVFLVLENQVLTKIEKTTQAVVALFASFYVFNIRRCSHYGENGGDGDGHVHGDVT